MTRLVLALIAILLLALSAGLTNTQLPPPGSTAASSLQAHPAFSAEFDFVPTGQPRRTPAPHMGEDAPEPALIAYLALVLIGSVVAVGIVRHSARDGR